MASTSREDLIVVSSEGSELPYSRGLTAASIAGSGLPPDKAYAVAETVLQRLLRSGIKTVDADTLEEVIAETIEELAGTRFAANYRRWRSVSQLDRPLIILIGGATGVGKSTIATLLASRLGITRVIPTDAIREVMRGMLTKELMPTLHTSSFDAESSITQPLPRSADKAIIGFREQVQVVAVGINALIRRAVVEKTSLIVEGAHCCPGFLDLPDPDEAVVVHMVIAIESERLHRSHFGFRALEASKRAPEHYLKHFSNIRKIQRYIRNLALRTGVAVIESYDVDSTLASCIDLVLERVTEATRSEQKFRLSAPVPVDEAASKASGSPKANTS